MRSLLIFFLLVISKLIFAQSYNKFLDASVWYQNVNYGWTGNVTYPYNQDDDTVINSITYSKINSSSYVCALREDTINKIVYKVDPGDTLEYKLYNFNLALLDTFSVRIMGTYYPGYVQVVDTVMTLQGPRKRFKWNINIGSTRQIWVIESVGSLDDPIKLFFPILDPVYSLVCTYQNELQVYQNSSGLSCPSITTALIEAQQEKTMFTLYPNPNNGHFKIKLAESGNYRLDILNPLGQLVQQEFVVSGEHTIHLNSKRGLYSIRITNLNSGASRVQKIVISN